MAGDFVYLLLFRTQGLANDGIVDRIESKLLRRRKITKLRKQTIPC